jgi:hypothetical protein
MCVVKVVHKQYNICYTYDNNHCTVVEKVHNGVSIKLRAIIMFVSKVIHSDQFIKFYYFSSLMACS